MERKLRNSINLKKRKGGKRGGRKRGEGILEMLKIKVTGLKKSRDYDDRFH